MPPLLEHILSVFFGFLAIMNPIANTPIFLGLTADRSPNDRKRTALHAVIAAFLIVFAFTLLGKAIFSLFGLSMPAFRIMGGVLVAMIGFQMLHGQQSSAHHPAENETATDDAGPDVALSPLAIPILAGPGTIATAMNYASDGDVTEYAVTVGAFAVLCSITYICFRMSDRIGRLLGPSGFAVVTRLMGLIVGCIGIQMLIDGIIGAFAGRT